MSRIDWRRAQLAGRPTLDSRYEFDRPDRAARWLQAAERRQRQEKRIITPITAPSTSEVPW